MVLDEQVVGTCGARYFRFWPESEVPVWLFDCRLIGGNRKQPNDLPDGAFDPNLGCRRPNIASAPSHLIKSLEFRFSQALLARDSSA